MVDPVYQRLYDRPPRNHWFRCWLREERRTWILVGLALVIATLVRTLFLGDAG